MVYIGMARYISHVTCINNAFNSPRNDQPSAKTTDLSLAIGTAYESIHTFVFSHEKSLIREFSSSSSFFFFFLFFSKRPRASKEGVKPLIFIPN